MSIRLVPGLKRILLVVVTLSAVAIGCSSVHWGAEPVASTPEPTQTATAPPGAGRCAGAPAPSCAPTGTAEPDLWARVERLELQVTLLEMYLDETLQILSQFRAFGGLSE